MPFAGHELGRSSRKWHHYRKPAVVMPQGRKRVRGLVIELQTHLQLTRSVPLAVDSPESRIPGRIGRRREVCDGIVENNIVEEVERFGSEFKESLFSEPEMELSENGEIDIVVVLRNKRVHFFAAVGVRRRQRESGRIDPLLLRRVGGNVAVWIANYVHSLLLAAADVLGVLAGSHRVRLPRSLLDNAVERPSPANFGDKLIGGPVQRRLRCECQ